MAAGFGSAARRRRPSPLVPVQGVVMAGERPAYPLWPLAYKHYIMDIDDDNDDDDNWTCLSATACPGLTTHCSSCACSTSTPATKVRKWEIALPSVHCLLFEMCSHGILDENQFSANGPFSGPQ